MVCYFFLFSRYLINTTQINYFFFNILGAQMILAMKAISLAFDLDLGRVTVLPSLSQYAGYILHVGSVVFGPWFSYQDYLRSLNGNEKKVVRKTQSLKPTVHINDSQSI